MKTKRAFTLIELLVVIAVIGVLLAVLIPSLQKAKDLAKRTICLANLHALGQAWVLYADQNDGRLVNSKTARVVEVPSAGGSTFVMNTTTYHNETTWVGWWDGDPLNTKATEACLKLGALYPIVESTKVYRCPVGMKDQYRTCSIPDAMNGHDGFTIAAGYNPPGKVVRKMSELRSPGSRMSFIDEGLASTESWTIYPDRVSWWDAPPVRHGEGTTVAMADGSAEYWKWHDQDTLDFAKGILTDPVSTALNNPDFTKLQIACWGKAAPQ